MCSILDKIQLILPHQYEYGYLKKMLDEDLQGLLHRHGMEAQVGKKF